MKFFILFLALVLGGAAFFAPPLYVLLRDFFGAENFWPYARVFNRIVLLFLLVALFLARKRFKLQQIKPFFYKDRLSLRLKDFTCGFLLSLLISLPLIYLIASSGQLIWPQQDYSFYLLKFAKIFPAAVLTSFIEETIFRLLLLTALLSYIGLRPAVLLASLVYAWVHFIAPDKTFVMSSFTPLDGFNYLAHVIAESWRFELLPAIAGLFLVGMTLSYALLRTQSVYLGVGLHTGWIIVIKITSFADLSPELANNISAIGRRYYLLGESSTWIAIVAVLVGLHFYCNFREKC